jgi:hypothetical protein
MDYEKFMASMGTVMPGRELELLTVAPDGREFNEANRHTGPKLDSTGKRGNLEAGHTKREALRAILRAPESVQDLYQQGLVSQITAAKLGPKKPTPDRKALIAEVRQEIEKLPPEKKPADYRRSVDRLIRERMGARPPSKLERVLRLVATLTPAEYRILLEELMARRPKGGE